MARPHLFSALRRLASTALAFGLVAGATGCDSDDANTGDAADTAPTAANESGESGAVEGGEASATSEGETEASGDTDAAACLADGDNPSEASVMNELGTPCEADSDCSHIGAGAVCDTCSVIYDLPGGYCGKVCEHADETAIYTADAADCDPEGGQWCIGVNGVYTRCAIECTDDSQCDRAGYVCRVMPDIGMPGDPKFCLPPEACGPC